MWKSNLCNVLLVSLFYVLSILANPVSRNDDQISLSDEEVYKIIKGNKKSYFQTLNALNKSFIFPVELQTKYTPAELQEMGFNPAELNELTVIQGVKQRPGGFFQAFFQRFRQLLQRIRDRIINGLRPTTTTTTKVQITVEISFACFVFFL